MVVSTETISSISTLMVTDSVALRLPLKSDKILFIVGLAVSRVQLNTSLAAVLAFPARSSNLFAATSMLQSPSPVGVNVAVKTESSFPAPALGSKLDMAHL